MVGVQDLGAAGLSCAAAEPAARAGVGLDLDLDQVHVRESGMTAAELLMSESQERMMAFVPPERVPEVLEVAAALGDRCIGGRDGSARRNGAGHPWWRGRSPRCRPSLWPPGPAIDRPAGEPWWLEDGGAAPTGTSALPTRPRRSLALLDDPALADRSWVFEQYDHLLFLDTVVGPGSRRRSALAG